MKYKSCFCDESKIDDVAKIRSSVFGENLVSNELVNLTEKMICQNKKSYRLIIDSETNEALCYYSVIPIDSGTYKGFLNQEKDYFDILKNSIEQDKFKTEEKYLFGSGIVTKKGIENERSVRSYLLCDLMKYLSLLLDDQSVKGFLAFPTTKEAEHFYRKFDVFNFTNKYTQVNDLQFKIFQAIVTTDFSPYEYLKSWMKQNETIFYRYDKTVEFVLD